MIKRIFIGLLFSLLYLPVAIAAPASWTVKDSDTTIILFGTFHIAKADMQWMTEETSQQINQSKRLYLELAPDQMSEAIMAPLMLTKGLLSQGQKLSAILPNETHLKLESYLTSKGIPVNAFDTMRPWFAAVMIAMQEYAIRGYSPEFGGEKLITDKAKERGIPILGFETARFQIDTLSTGGLDEEILSLSLTLDDMERVDTIINDLTNAWLSGDDPTLDKLLHAELSRVPGMEKRLIHDRNKNWSTQLNQLMKEPGYFFVAVGAAHLIGDKGVPNLLKNAGHKVIRN